MPINTIVFANSKNSLNFIEKNIFLNKKAIITLRKDVYNYSKNVKIKVMNPLNYGYYFLTHDLPVEETMSIRYKFGYNRFSYQKITENIFNSFFKINEIKYLNNIDFYANGDWNLVDDLTLKLLYPIDIVLSVIEQSNYDFIYSIDDKKSNDRLESYILSHIIKKEQLEIIEV